MATVHQRISTSAVPSARHGAGPSRCSWMLTPHSVTPNARTVSPMPRSIMNMKCGEKIDQRVERESAR